MKTQKINNPNNFEKRTSAQVKSILKSVGIYAEVYNDGDGQQFSVVLESNIRNRNTLKKLGFLLGRGAEGDKYITIITH